VLFGLYEQDVVALVLLGVLANFAYTFSFSWYLSHNIGVEEMMLSRGNRRLGWLTGFSLLVPFAKMLLTLYRVAVLQLLFLNQGRTHKEFWVYLTHDGSENA
jgi:hypothetical protein